MEGIPIDRIMRFLKGADQWEDYNAGTIAEGDTLVNEVKGLVGSAGELSISFGCNRTWNKGIKWEMNHLLKS